VFVFTAGVCLHCVVLIIVKMEKSELRRLILSNSERILLHPGEGTSDVWHNFVKVAQD